MTEEPQSTPGPVPPSVPPMTELPPGFSPNGHKTPTAEALQRLETVIGQLPQMLFQAVAAALQQAPLTVKPGLCGTCGRERLAWAAQHQADVARAEAAYKAALTAMAAKPAQDQVPVNGLGFLPVELRPGGAQAAPDIQEGMFLINGTWHCANHHPDLPAAQGRRQFLIANTGLNPAMINELRGQAA